jgi:hypothetical protein
MVRVGIWQVCLRVHWLFFLLIIPPLPHIVYYPFVYHQLNNAIVQTRKASLNTPPPYTQTHTHFAALLCTSLNYSSHSPFVPTYIQTAFRHNSLLYHCSVALFHDVFALSTAVSTVHAAVTTTKLKSVRTRRLVPLWGSRLLLHLLDKARLSTRPPARLGMRWVKKTVWQARPGALWALVIRLRQPQTWCSVPITHHRNGMGIKQRAWADDKGNGAGGRGPRLAYTLFARSLRNRRWYFT